MRNFIKKYIHYDIIRLFYPVRSDEEIISNCENNIFFIPIMSTASAVLLFCSGKSDNITRIAFIHFIIAFILGVEAKRHIKKIRKYVNLVDLFTFAFLEYILLILLECNVRQRLFELAFYTICICIIALLLKLPYIIKAHQVERKDSIDQANKCKKVISVSVLVLIFFCVFVCLQFRRDNVESISVLPVISVMHLMISMFYNLEINRIIVELLYREEVAAELEKRRKALK